MSKHKKIIVLIAAISACLASTFVFADNSVGQGSMTPGQIQENRAAFAKILSQAKVQPSATTGQASVPVQSKSVVVAQNPTNTQVHHDVLSGTQLNDQAFAAMSQNIMPLTPKQVTTLHTLLDQERRAAATSPGTPPKPTSSSVMVNLSPGATPPVIRLGAGFITSLIFLDASGQVWPIQAYDLGNPKNYNVKLSGKGSALMVQALTQYQPANLAVVLKGMDTPVMLTLLPGQNTVDYRVDLRVPKLGPNAQARVTNLPGTGSSSLLSVLDGVPPQGSKQLTVTGGDASAWLSHGHIFLQTRLTLLSPSWVSTMRSADGTNAYELQKAPVLLALDHGQMVNLNIEGLQ